MTFDKISVTGMIGKNNDGTKFRHRIVVTFGLIPPLDLVSSEEFDDIESCRADLNIKTDYMNQEVQHLMTMPLPDLQKEYRNTAQHLH